MINHKNIIDTYNFNKFIFFNENKPSDGFITYEKDVSYNRNYKDFEFIFKIKIVNSTYETLLDTKCGIYISIYNSKWNLYNGINEPEI